MGCSGAFARGGGVGELVGGIALLIAGGFVIFCWFVYWVTRNCIWYHRLPEKDETTKTTPEGDTGSDGYTGKDCCACWCLPCTKKYGKINMCEAICCLTPCSPCLCVKKKKIKYWHWQAIVGGWSVSKIFSPSFSLLPSLLATLTYS